MTDDEKKALKIAGLAGAGTALGAGTAIAGVNSVPLHHAGIAGTLNNFAYGFTNALKHHARLSTALGAGTTAVIGHGAVATAAVAAAPAILAVGATALAGYGIFRLCKAVISAESPVKEPQA